MSVRRVASDPGWLVPLAFLAAVAFQVAFALGAARSSVTTLVALPVLLFLLVGNGH